MFYAHSQNENNQWHLLEDHLFQTAVLAEKECKKKELKPLCYNLGLLHDLGKLSIVFQDKVMGNSNESFNHPGFSIYLIDKYLHSIFQLNNIKYIIYELLLAHHKGLSNVIVKDLSIFSKYDNNNIKSFIEYNITSKIKNVDMKYLSYFESLIIFSCLIRADWIDTGKHFGTYKYNEFVKRNDTKKLKNYVNKLK